MSPASASHPFLFIDHGTPDVDSLGKSEQVFVWFRDPVAAADRERIVAGLPSPLQDVRHWDREFVCLGSRGDSYGLAVLLDHTPEPERSALRTADPAGWQRAFEAATERLDEAAADFAAALEQWVLGVHAIAPVALFWGPAGTADDDAWHQWSVANFADVMAGRLARYTPDRGGREHLAWIKRRCAPLLVAPARTRPTSTDAEARAIATLDAACREGRPTEFVSRLTYAEGELLGLGELIAAFVGTTVDRATRLERLAPLTQLIYLAGYDVDHEWLGRAYPSLPERARLLIEALAPDEQRSAVPLAVMMAQTITRDTPAFDRPLRRNGALAAHVLRVAFDQPGCRGATYARASRYLRWAKRYAEARSTAEEGIFRYGERRTLLRAAFKAARAMGDEAAARSYEEKFNARLRDTPRPRR